MNEPITVQLPTNRSSRSRVWRRPASLVADALQGLRHDDVAVLARIEWRDPRGSLERLGPHSRTALVVALGDRLSRELPAAEVSADASSVLLYSVVLVGVTATDAAELLRRSAARWLNDREQPVAGLTPLIGLAPFGLTSDPVAVVDAAEAALRQALTHLDLTPVICRPQGRAEPSLVTKPSSNHTVAVAGVSLPILAALFGALAADTVLVFATNTCLVLTAIWLALRCSGALASRARRAPPGPAERGISQSFTAIITAAEPRHLASALETAASLLGQSSGTVLQVILAHGVVRDDDAEALAAWAERDRRFLPVRVAAGGASAALVNAALECATGNVTTVLTRGDRIDTASFERANRWLGAGWDLMQGPVVPTGPRIKFVGLVARLEETSLRPRRLIGTAALFDVTIGDAGTVFWRTEMLRRVRHRHLAVSPEADAVTRAVVSGGRSGYDAGLRTLRPAPTALGQLWRSRWQEARSAGQALAQSRQALWRPRSLPLRRWLGLLAVLAVDHLLPLALLLGAIVVAAASGASGHLPMLPDQPALRGVLAVVLVGAIWPLCAVLFSDLSRPAAGTRAERTVGAISTRLARRVSGAMLGLGAATLLALLGVAARLATLADAIGDAPRDLDSNE